MFFSFKFTAEVCGTAERRERVQFGESSSSDASRARRTHARSLHRIRRRGTDTADESDPPESTSYRQSCRVFIPETRIGSKEMGKLNGKW